MILIKFKILKEVILCLNYLKRENVVTAVKKLEKELTMQGMKYVLKTA